MKSKYSYSTCNIFQSEIEILTNYIADCPNIETGGELFGYWSSQGEATIKFISGPGPNAYHNVAFFRQDPDFLEKLGQVMFEKFGLYHIGTWHSHHRLGLEYPSSHDSYTMNKAVQTYDFNKFLLIIGTIKNNAPSMRGFVYPNAIKNEQLEFNVMDKFNPIRLKLHQIDSELIIKSKSRKNKMEGFEKFGTNRPRTFAVSSWLNSKEGRLKLHQISNELIHSFSDVKIMLNSEKEEPFVSFSTEGERFELHFPASFPLEIPDLYWLGEGEKLNISSQNWPEDSFSKTEQIVIDFIKESFKLSFNYDDATKINA